MDDNIGYISFRIEAKWEEKLFIYFFFFEKIYLETNGMMNYPFKYNKCLFR